MALVGVMAFASLAIAGLLGWAVFGGGGFVQESVIGTEEQRANVEETARVVSQGLRTGTAATVNSRIYDLQDANSAQVATNLTIEEWNGGGVGVGDVRLIEDGTLSSISADTASATSIGKTLYMVAGVGTHTDQTNAGTAYYGIPKTLLVDEETENVRLDSNRATSTISAKCVDDGQTLGNASGTYGAVSVAGTNPKGCRVTVGAGQIVSLDYISVEVNVTDRAFNFKALGVNMSTVSDIEDVRMSGNGGFEGFDSVPSSTWTKASGVPSYFTQNAHNVKHYFELSEAVLVNEWDVVKTPPFVLDADADNPSEEAQVYFIDEQYYRQAGGQQRIAKGVQTDTETPRNIGAPTLMMELHIN